MAVKINIQNSNQYPIYEGLAVKNQGESVSVLTVPSEKDFCLCSIECDYSEYVFWHEDGLDRHNDKSSFLFAKQRNADTVVFELLKNDIKVSDLNNSDHGIYYNGFSGKPLYIGYVVDWNKVYLTHGNGRYHIKITLNILGAETVIETSYFNLTHYSDEIADGTIKIEAYNTGNIIGSDLDYTDLLPDGWYTSYRIHGFFGKKQPVLEQDNFMDSRYNIVQIQDKIISEYSLSTKWISADFANQIFFRDMLANTILISDYNLLNAENYDRVNVVPIDVDDVTYKEFGTTVMHKWKFKDRIEDNIKTNY